MRRLIAIAKRAQRIPERARGVVHFSLLRPVADAAATGMARSDKQYGSWPHMPHEWRVTSASETATVQGFTVSPLDGSMIWRGLLAFLGSKFIETVSIGLPLCGSTIGSSRGFCA